MVTSLYAGLLALMFLALSVHVVNGRRQFRVGMGDAQNHELLRRIRAQGNFAEYTLFFLVLLGYADINHLPNYIIHILGIVFIIGRVMHAYSLLKAEEYVDGKIKARPYWRVRGIMCTYSCILALALISIVQYLMAL